MKSSLQLPIVKWGSVLFAVVLLAGCASSTVLTPAPGVAVAGESNAGAAEADGVHVVAVANDWSGRPLNLVDITTPVLVSIRNGSDRSIEIRYKDFSITGPAGVHSAALPPYQIDGRVPPAYYPVVPEFSYSGFFLAPLYAPYYDWDFDDWDGPFDWDMGYYGMYYRTWNLPLPSRDMLRKGIPEGVLDKGGSISGYLYFTKVKKTKGSPEVEFNFDLNNTKGKQFGVVHIPFIEK